MKLKRISANKLNRISRKKKVICFGAGELLAKTFCDIKDLNIEKNIAFIVDNDSSKWGQKKRINNSELKICIPEKIYELDAKEYCILITTMRIKEVYAQLQNMIRDSKIACYCLPSYRYGSVKYLSFIASKMPLRNYILLQGEGDTYENASALARYIRSNNYYDKYKIVWLCDNPQRFIPTKRERYIKRNVNLTTISLKEIWRYNYYVNCSRYVFFENQMTPRRREQQVTMYMNHGSPPIKSTKGKINISKDVNYVVCPSENVADIVAEQYGVNKERMIYCGSPRTDILFDGKLNDKLCSMLDVKEYKKVILWVPTFREHKNKSRVDSDANYTYGIPIIHNENVYDELVSYLKMHNVLLIIKPHQNQDMSKVTINPCKNICILRNDQLEKVAASVYDVMKIADAMITDYSTIAFDFMMLDKMIGYTLDDFEEFKIGFSVKQPLEFMPGNKIYNVNHLLEFFDCVIEKKDDYMDERKKINEFINEYKGNNCERLLKKLRMI